MWLWLLCVCVCVITLMWFLSRFGFIVFESVDAVEKVLSATEDQLILDGR